MKPVHTGLVSPLQKCEYFVRFLFKCNLLLEHFINFSVQFFSKSIFLFSRQLTGMAFSVTVDLSVSIELGLSFSVKTTGEGFSSNDMPIGSENLAIMEISERDGEAATANELESESNAITNESECEPELMPDAEVRGVATKPESGSEPKLISLATDVEIRDVESESECEPELMPDAEVRGVATKPESGSEPKLISLATDVEIRDVESEFECEPELVSLATDDEVRADESLADLLVSFARAQPSNLDNWSGSSSCSPSCLNLIWEEYLVREGRMVESDNGEDEDDEMPLEENDDVVFLCEVRRV